MWVLKGCCTWGSLSHNCCNPLHRRRCIPMAIVALAPSPTAAKKSRDQKVAHTLPALFAPTAAIPRTSASALSPLQHYPLYITSVELCAQRIWSLSESDQHLCINLHHRAIFRNAKCRHSWFCGIVTAKELRDEMNLEAATPWAAIGPLREKPIRDKRHLACL